MKNIYVGNLPEDMNKQDICEFCDLHSTSYLRDTCNMHLSKIIRPKNVLGFVFIRAPAHVRDKLITLDDITYYDNELRVEDATSAGKRTNHNTSNKSRRPCVVINNHPENQHLYGKESSATESKSSKRSYFWWQHTLWRKVT